MNQVKLEHFLAASDMGSFQSAARLMKTTASAISYSVNDLENIFKTSLFIRSKTGVSLTEFGEELARFARRYFHEIESLHLKAQKKENQVQKIKIGTFASMAMYFGPSLLKSLNKNKNIVASVTTSRSHALFESVVRRDVDIVISVEPPSHPDVESVFLYEDSYCFYIDRKIKKNKLSKKDLTKTPLLFMPEAATGKGRNLLQFIRENELKFESEFEFNSLEVIKEYCSKSLGVGILPKRVARLYKEELSQATITGTKKEFGTHGFYLSYRIDSEIKMKTINYILNFLQEVVKE